LHEGMQQSEKFFFKNHGAGRIDAAFLENWERCNCVKICWRK